MVGLDQISSLLSNRKTQVTLCFWSTLNCCGLKIFSTLLLIVTGNFL
ncbi:hypothetical protein LINGRAHAP2_LOCUS32275 [Linum grandiflorum]